MCNKIGQKSVTKIGHTSVTESGHKSVTNYLNGPVCLRAHARIVIMLCNLDGSHQTHLQILNRRNVSVLSDFANEMGILVEASRANLIKKIFL